MFNMTYLNERTMQFCAGMCKNQKKIAMDVQKFTLLSLKNICSVQDTVQKMCINVTHWFRCVDLTLI